MRAAAIRRFGGPEELFVADLPQPTPGEGEVLIKVAYAGVNPVDYKIRDGSNRVCATITDDDFPLVLGEECSGTVEAVGAGVQGFAVGDRVFAMAPMTHHCYAEYVTLPSPYVAVLSPDADLKVHGGAAQAGLTAWASVFDQGHVTADDVVLVHGGGGGVGQIIVQLAASTGAKVFATASGKHRDKLERWGAHHVDYTTEDFTEVVPKPSVVIDGVYFNTYERSLAMLEAGDRMVVLPSLADLGPAQARGIEASITAITFDPGRLDQLAAMIADGSLEIVVSEVFGLDAAADAHRLVETGHAEGKVLLQP